MSAPEAAASSLGSGDVRRATLQTLVAHGVALFGLAVLLVAVVPRYEVAFRDARMTLPAATHTVIRASNLTKLYAILLLPIVLGADAGVFVLLRLYAKTKTPSRVWSLLVLIGLLLCAVYTIVALRLPMA